MKNIYEDSSNHNDAQDVMSGSYENSSEKAGGEKKRPQAGEIQMPALQLTPEQISALVAQLVSARPDIVGDLLSTPKEEKDEPEQQAAPASKTNPGKKIVFQSEDFEESSSGRALPDINIKDDEEPFAEEEAKPWTQAPKSTEVSFFESDVDEEEFSYASVKPVSASVKKYEFEEPEVPLGSSISVEDFDEEEAFVPEKKKRSKGEIIRLSVLSVAIVAIIVSGIVLLHEYKLSKDNKEYESSVSDLIVDVPETTPSKDDKKENEKVELTIEQQWEEIKRQYPNTIFPPKIQLKYAKLYATNPEFVGYLSAEGIGLSLPVVQAKDDEKYLTKNFYGQSTKYGCPFVSYLNNIVTLDRNTVIFGHHMNDKTIFGALDAYKSVEGYKKAPVITFNTMYNDYQWKIVSVFITNANMEDDDNYVFQYYFANLRTQANFQGFLDELSRRSLYDTGVDVNTSDKLLTLSTCSHEFENARLVVVARLVRSGESAQVNTDNVVANGNPRYPQVYYKKLKKENPYVNVDKWYIQ